MAEPKRSLSWRTKLFLLLAVFSVLPVAGLGFWTLETLAVTFEKAMLEGLKGMAVAKSEAIDQFTGYRRRDIELIAGLLSDPLTRLKQAHAQTSKPPEPPPSALPELPDADALGAQSAAPQAPGRPPRVAPKPKVSAPRAPVPAPAPTPAADAAGKGAGSTHEPAKPVKSKAVEDAEAALRETLSLKLADQQDFEELLVIDSEGRVVVSTFQGHEGTTAEALEYFDSGRKRTYVQSVFLSPITKLLTMVIATPIYDHERREVGVLAARLNLERFFRLISETTGLGRSGETVVAKRIGSSVVFMAPTRHDPDAAIKRSIPIDADYSLPVREAVRGLSGAGAAEDYRNVEVLAAWNPIPALDWGLVVKMDYDEVMEGVYGARVRTALVTLVIALIALFASFLAAEALVRPLRHLKYAAERISRGDLGVELSIRSRDEIGELATSFERMIAAIKFFREQSHSQPDSDDMAPPDPPSERA